MPATNMNINMAYYYSNVNCVVNMSQTKPTGFCRIRKQVPALPDVYVTPQYEFLGVTSDGSMS